MKIFLVIFYKIYFIRSIKYMIGKYDINDEKIRTLPKLMSTEEECHNKLLSQNNSSYVDCFLAFV